MRLDVSFRKTLAGSGRRVELDVSFGADADRLVLFGPSGAGKTLTLHAIAGLTSPDTGRIALDGDVWFDISSGIDVPARHRRVGLMFQEYALFPHLTVAGNVGAVYARPWIRGRSAAAVAEVERLLATFGLRAVRDAYPSELSGGQRQRVALARALAGRPRILLLDEPFAALDESLRTAARNELRAVQDACGVPMVVITHDPRDVDVLAQTVVTIDAGRVVASRASGLRVTLRDGAAAAAPL
jgi:molybdate transport system ATP-binding protein